MRRWIIGQINGWVILVGVLVAGVLSTLFVLLLFWLPYSPSTAAEPPGRFTVIVAPTQTPLPTESLQTPTPTNPPSFEGISIGSYVQITGTEGQGLRLRSGAGTNNPPRFLGMDAEVFQVKDGPKTADNFTWWFLEAPYDPGRSGWAASTYLKAVDPSLSPTATPKP
jgi:hypothetical protein